MYSSRGSHMVMLAGAAALLLGGSAAATDAPRPQSVPRSRFIKPKRRSGLRGGIPKRLAKTYKIARYSEITAKRKAQKRARRITRLHKTTRR